MERITCAELMGYLEKEPEKVMVLDIETTGFYAPADEVLSLAIIDGTGETLFYDSFKPEHNTAWPEAQAVNGISPDDVADRPIFAEETEYINLLLAKAEVIVGYNQEGFDLPFLAHFGVCPPEEVKLADVMMDYAEIHGEWDTKHQDWKWQKLTACAAHYNYQYHAHDSLKDAEATLFCARKCAEEQLQKRAAYRLLESGKTIYIQACDGGYDYTIYDVDDKAIDGGRLDNENYTLLDARNELLVELAPMESVFTYMGEALDSFLNKVAEAEERSPAEQKKEMQVLIVRPGEYAQRVKIDGSLKSMQDIVEGMIEVVYPWQERVALVCNDEGLLEGLPLNRYVPEMGQPIAGTFFVCGFSDDRLTGLTDEQLARFGRMFHNPQQFLFNENKELYAVMDCVPTEPMEEP